MKITIPELSLIVLIGSSGSGKSTFAKTHFKSSEIISSDFCRGLVSDDETNLNATNDAFDVLHYIAAKRLARGNLTVIDATNVRSADRKPLLQLAKEYHVIPVAIALNLPPSLCHERNQQREDRNFGFQVVRRHCSEVRRSLGNLKREGFRYVYTLSSLEEINTATIERQPLWNNLKQETGPFDIIGDIHGCCDELEALLTKLGYQIDNNTYFHPQGRKAVFLGDLVDRGNRILDTLNLVKNMVSAGNALCVPGNHDAKLLKKLQGRKVQIKHGLEQTLAEIEQLPPDKKESWIAENSEFLNSLISHYVLDEGKLVVAHAGMKEAFQGRGSRAVREFALYGESTGEIDEFGLPVRYQWAADYRGNATVVYGHTPVPQPEWLNHTINIDTGCVFGGKLTALRYPERELVSVTAKMVYCEPIKPLIIGNEELSLTAQQEYDDVLELDDVLGKRLINTKFKPRIMIREENAIAALEVMSRFAANPKWLIYLPPTMSPSETSNHSGLLEHPQEAFSYYQHQRVTQVICEEKHMGSRAIVIICQDEEAAQRRFGVENQGIGICYTRTGRHFFSDSDLEAQFLQRLQQALSVTDFWQKFNTDWVCLDCELMPWSMKAQQLIQQQYASVGIAAEVALSEAVKLLQQAATNGIEVSDTLTQYQQRYLDAQKYVKAYQGYCWPVKELSDLKLAPFHVLATENTLHTDKNHLWHLQTIAEIAQADSSLLLATPYRIVNLDDAASVTEAIDWWSNLTNTGGEGMVVKPLHFLAQKEQNLIQPSLKCRGREYLRIIYGPEYTNQSNLEQLRRRGLSKKRSLAIREFCLGIEALERFVSRQPLRRVHECVFGILALESEPIDPRL